MLIVFDKMTYKNKYDDNSNIDTISYPPADLLKVKLIERRSKAISAIENYYKLQDMEAQGFLWEVKAKVRSLFYEISAVYRRNNEKEYIKIMENLTSNEFSDIEEVFHQINQ